MRPRFIVRCLFGLVLCFCSAVALSEQSWVLVEGGAWVPEASVVSEMKVTLEAHMKNVAAERKRQLKKWRGYTFQYQGITVGGQNFVIVNALCTRYPEWKLEKQMVQVFDGGTCFFNIKFDPKRRQYLKPVINGDA